MHTTKYAMPLKPIRRVQSRGEVRSVTGVERKRDTLRQRRAKLTASLSLPISPPTLLHGQ